MTMLPIWGAATCCILLTIICPVSVNTHSLSASRAHSVGGVLRMEPSESIVYPGDNVTYVCFYPSNVTFHWDFSSEIHSYDVQQGRSLTDNEGNTVFFSQLTIYSTSRRMSGEVICSISSDDARAIGFLIVNGVRNGAACRATSDCVTDKATCQNGTCKCPTNYVRLRVDRGYDICREMIHRLYDPCEYDEQCIHLVDPKSVCKSVCVCSPSTRDRKGKCVTLNEISYNRNQEMYRVGLIAVTCIIILIVAVSLWVTLKRSCHENTMEENVQALSSRLSIDIANDKPPSYDDVLVSQDAVASPPDMKEALKNCMSAKKLLRQVSAPAGQLLTQPKMGQSKTGSKDFPPI